MDGPVRQNAGVAISDGKILALGSWRELHAAYPKASFVDLGRVVLFPGLVNAHVHLELSALNQGERPASFVEWLKRGLSRSVPEPEVVREFVSRSVEIGVGQSVRFGVTTLGDISRQCAISRPMLKAGPLRVVSFGEVQGMAQRRGFLDERIATAIDRADESEFLRVGISPHAPYSVEAEGYRRSLAAARKSNMPIATHLAETLGEASFLADHTGDFRELWRYLDAWDDRVPAFAGGPIRFAREIGLLDYPTLLAHVNYCDDEELALLAAGKASVVYCPRTHEYFGHPSHRWREMLAAGINVAVGTDSCASSPNLNLVDDLRFLRRLAPEMPASALWEMGTIRAARAIGWEERVGSLTPGKSADFVAFAVGGNDPLEEILREDIEPKRIWIGGAEVSTSK